jgi:SAM-dependent methyltransferase
MDSEVTLLPVGRIRRSYFCLGHQRLVRLAMDIHHRIYTQYCEWRFGVSTLGLIQSNDLGVENPDAMGYSALEYQHIFWALQTIPFPAPDVVFVDYGAGKGRVLAVAAARRFQKVIGVEISESLACIARRNLGSMKHRRAAQLEFHCCDAASFPVPDNGNVFFFFNPFIGVTLSEVIHRIHRSWCSHPRDLFVVFFNHREFDQCVQSQDWLRKVHETAFCGLYRAI